MQQSNAPPDIPSICCSNGCFASAQLEPPTIASAVEYSMLPTNVSIKERFQLAKDTGFERVECRTTKNPGEAERIKKAVEKAVI